MAASDIFTLNTSIAPRLLRLLYGLALILIGLMVIFGLARGVALMASPMRMRPAPAVQAMAKPATPPTATAPATPTASTSAPAATPARGFGPGRRGFHPARGGMRGRGPRMMRGAPPVLAGSLEILRTLIMGAIALMVVRILAEIALALLADQRRQSP